MAAPPPTAVLEVEHEIVEVKRGVVELGDPYLSQVPEGASGPVPVDYVVASAVVVPDLG